MWERRSRNDASEAGYEPQELRDIYNLDAVLQSEPLLQPGAARRFGQRGGHGRSGAMAGPLPAPRSLVHGAIRRCMRREELSADPQKIGFAYGGEHPGTRHAHGELVRAHTVRYSVGRAGTYRLHVGLRHQRRVLPGSPFLLNVVPGAASALGTRLAPAALPLVAAASGEWSEGLVLATRDSVGNRCVLGGGAVAVQSDAPSVECDCEDREDGTYLLSWRAQSSDEADTAAAGRVVFALSVTIDGVHILGSPAPMIIRDTGVSEGHEPRATGSPAISLGPEEGMEMGETASANAGQQAPQGQQAQQEQQAHLLNAWNLAQQLHEPAPQSAPALVPEPWPQPAAVGGGLEPGMDAQQQQQLMQAFSMAQQLKPSTAQPVAIPQQQQVQELPEGWIEAMDPSSSQPYYVHSQTSHTQWEHPGGEAQRHGQVDVA